jgi:hypothetical protein
MYGLWKYHVVPTSWFASSDEVVSRKTLMVLDLSRMVLYASVMEILYLVSTSWFSSSDEVVPMKMSNNSSSQ